MIHLPTKLQRRSPRRCRGSIYLLVLGMIMIIGVIGFGGLMVSRIQLRTANAANDFAVSRLCARAGMEAAMHKMRTDPTWRTDLGNGTWFNKVPLGQGNYSVSAADPISGDITIATNHPVVLTGTGSKGTAVYSLQVAVQVSPAGLGCLSVNACCNHSLGLSSATLTSNQIVASNASGSNAVNIDSGSVMNANAEAVGTCGGNGTYAKAKAVMLTPLSMPDPVHVFDYYTTNGTAIPLASLYQSNATQIIPNPSFETNIAGWYVYSGSSTVTMAQDGTAWKDGRCSLWMKNRATVNDVPATDLPLASIRKGDTYAINICAMANSTGTFTATLVLQASGGTVSFSTAAGTFKTNNNWINARGSFTPTWSGTLTKATLVLTTTEPSEDLRIDAWSLTDTSLPNSAYVMDRVLLSPGSNPYGATNTKGIYILDCLGNNVTIGPCRIVGTLVLLNAGNNTLIQGPITWEPAANGYPALLVGTMIAITIESSVGLSESTLGVNFNPTGTPYPYSGGTSNTTQTDAYPSVINGIIYCGGDINLSSSPVINGSLLSAGNINVSGTSLKLTYNADPYVFPPPGFSTGQSALTPLAGSWKRVTN